MPATIIAQSNALTLDVLLTNLANHSKVDGIARFGSRLTSNATSTSDYDLLIMVDDPPVQIFQLQTYINNIMTDVAFVETNVADRIIVLEDPVPSTSSEGFLIGWLERAQILYDKTGRFTQIQHKLEASN